MGRLIRLIVVSFLLMRQAAGDEDSLHMTLPNGLHVFLVSNPEAKESTGAMSVQVGSWDDPSAFPGMAHFVEHMLFLGSLAYPLESEYMQYIHERGGECNAMTHRDHTVYGFSIQEGLEEALDRFSHLFIDPLFTEPAIAREMNAVHHEFEDNLENELFRIWRVFKEVGNPLHPNAQFSCGNLESLQGIQRQDIIEWFEQYYAPSSMRLVLVSKRPLDELKELSSHYFSRIPSRLGCRPVKKSGYAEKMMVDEYKGHVIHLNSVFKGRLLSLIWEVPKPLVINKKEGVFELVEMLINHGHGTGLSSHLAEGGLASDVKAEFWKMEEEHAIFRINIVLTEEGVKRYEDVLQACFRVLTFLQSSSIPKQLMQRVQKTGKEKLLLGGYQEVMEVASRLRQETRSLPENIEEVALDVKDLLAWFQACHCLYFLVAPSEESGVEPSRTERWMGARYLVRPISPDKLKEWQEVPPFFSHGYPPGERGETEGESIEQEGESFEPMVGLEPVFIVDNDKARIRLMQAGANPKRVEAFFCLATPMFGGTLSNTALYELFAEIVKSHLEEEFEGEDVRFAFGVEESKLCVFLSVEKHRALEVFRRFFSRIYTCRASEGEFLQWKKRYALAYEGDPEPLECANQLLDSLLSTSFYYTKMELYRQMAHLSYQEYEEFEGKAFTPMFIEGTFLGTLCRKEALALWKQLHSVFPFEGYSIKKNSDRSLFRGSITLVRHETHRKGSALLWLVAANGVSERKYVIQKVLSLALYSDFFRQLRTTEQTAYKLYNWVKLLNKNICHGFAIQSSTHSPSRLLERVDAFLKDYGCDIENQLSEERMGLIVETLVRKFQQERKAAEKETDRKSCDRKIHILSQLSYEEVISEGKEIFSSENTRKMGIMVEGVGKGEEGEKWEDWQVYLVEKEYFR